jgi:PPM family protein phosphatase
MLGTITSVVLRAYGLTDKGRVRPTNEDCFAVREDLGLCVIADGIGGHNAGEIAARLAVDAVVGCVASATDRAGVGLRSGCGQVGVGCGSGCGGEEAGAASDWRDECGVAPDDTNLDLDLWPFGFDPSLSPDANLLRTAVHLADVRIREAALSSCDCAGMGTTIVVARVSGGRLSVAHVGDSRLYVLAAGRWRQITTDDSWLASMLAHSPAADRLALEHHPMRHALTNVVGARSRTDVHVAEQPLAGGELLVLTTDGIHATLDEGRMEQVAVEGDEPQTIAHAMVRAALSRGSGDNCTAVVARYEAVS